jgi:hydroxymethylglutaryl-CoA reductase (NADPH)
MHRKINTEPSCLPVIPGRGLVVKSAIEMRQAFLEQQDISIQNIKYTNLELSEIQNNIESYIGSVEIPLGVVGPMLFKDEAQEELVYATVGALEGALVASMNRGAKAISHGGGFEAEVTWQKMVRSPLFLFETEEEAHTFQAFVKTEEENVAQLIKKYSNHADLLTIERFIRGKNVHLKLVFSTGDASGQNMTTTCSWHAIMHLVDVFKEKFDISPIDYVIEGNGAADKKISQYNISNGRGIRVVANCFLPEAIVNKVLRTTSKKMERFFGPSKSFAEEESMVGYNINVANAIAAFFVATGQDIGCVHESAVGFLELDCVEGGLKLQLTLPNLVVGTVGGGTNLKKQSEALDMMGCLGSGKVERFAKLIAGFALGLEISTYAAIVSGEFAKAHEKLGRNKPVQWLLKSELTTKFLSEVASERNGNNLFSYRVLENDTLDNGILTVIANRTSKKMIGFIPIERNHKPQNGEVYSEKLLLKSKALDVETVKGLHLMASSIDTELADLIKKYGTQLEYQNTHIKDIKIYEKLAEIGFEYMPRFEGSLVNAKREIYLFMQEFLDYSELRIINSENNPNSWSDADISSVLCALKQFHLSLRNEHLPEIQEFDASRYIPLYRKLLDITILEGGHIINREMLRSIQMNLGNWSRIAKNIKLSKTIIHNDFNSRNIAIRKNGTPVFYDLELAVVDFPTRDIVEFLSFVLPNDFTRADLVRYLGFYSDRVADLSKKNPWFEALCYSLETYIATRLSFYEVAGVIMKYDFSNRVLNVALKMLNILRDDR